MDMVSKQMLIVIAACLISLSGLAVGLSCRGGGDLSGTEVSIDGYGVVIDGEGNWVGQPIVGQQGPQGEQGPKGDTGDTGVQGPVGPQGLEGEQGEPGLPGAGVAWQGEWSDAATYSQNDGVSYQGSSYISRQDGNANHLPTDTAWWDLWVAKGDAGDQGPQGEQGVQGDTGATGATGSTGATGPQGIQGPAGPNMIVAMGYVFEDGELSVGYRVTSCVWDSVQKEYEIQIYGVDYWYYYYVTLVTIADIGPGRTAEIMSGSDKLLVRIYDLNGNPVQEHFSFMVLDTTP
jgi:hypothetical protein